MNSDNIILKAAQAASIDPTLARTMTEALAAAVREHCAALDSVAIPGFGTFTAQKTDEHVEECAGGSRRLVPPRIEMRFNPGSMLRKHLSAHE